MAKKPVTTFEADCLQCAFCVSIAGGVASKRGVCRRYPEPLPINSPHWCGEFIQKEIK